MAEENDLIEYNRVKGKMKPTSDLCFQPTGYFKKGLKNRTGKNLKN